MWPWEHHVYKTTRDSDVHSSEETLANPQGDGHEDEKKRETTFQQKPSGHSRIRRIGEVALVTISILLLWIALLFVWRKTTPSSVPHEKKTLTCGNSTEEAKARGCTFSLLANNWVAPQCIDPVTEYEYREWLFSEDRAHGPFPFFYDVEGKHHVKDEYALSLRANGVIEYDRRVYTTREQHLTHCVHVLRQLHRAMEGRARLNEEHNKIAHTQHCLTQLQLDNSAVMGKLVEECYIGFAECTVEEPI